jgi:hypothetical protein
VSNYLTRGLFRGSSQIRKWRQGWHTWLMLRACRRIDFAKWQAKERQVQDLARMLNCHPAALKLIRCRKRPTAEVAAENAARIKDFRFPSAIPPTEAAKITPTAPGGPPVAPQKKNKPKAHL